MTSAAGAIPSERRGSTIMSENWILSATSASTREEGPAALDFAPSAPNGGLGLPRLGFGINQPGFHVWNHLSLCLVPAMGEPGLKTWYATKENSQIEYAFGISLLCLDTVGDIPADMCYM